MSPTVVLSARGEQRLRSGHPWIYRSDVGDVQAAGGDRVAVRSARGRTLGYALAGDVGKDQMLRLARVVYEQLNP